MREEAFFEAGHDDGGNSRPFGAVQRHQPDARVARALFLVDLREQRQAVDEARRATAPARGSRTRAQPTRARPGSRPGSRRPRCARRAGPGGSRSDRASCRWRSTRLAASDFGQLHDQVAERTASDAAARAGTRLSSRPRDQLRPRASATAGARPADGIQKRQVVKHGLARTPGARCARSRPCRCRGPAR